MYFYGMFPAQCLMSLSGSAVAMIWEGHVADAEPILKGRNFGFMWL
jgi:hypothetical protein